MLQSMTLETLSPGACKLWKAMEEEPGRDFHRYAQMTGYTPRWVKTCYKKLVAAGVISPMKTQVQELSDDQQHLYDAMVALKVMPKTALRLVQTYPLAVIREKISYIRKATHINNPAGYLVRALDNNGDGTIRSVEPRGNGIISTQFVPPDVTPSTTESTVVVVPSLPQQANGAAPIQVNPADAPGIIALAYALNFACGLDLAVNPGDYWKVELLYRAGYTPQDVAYFLDHIWPTIWKSRGGKLKPTYDDLKEHIGHSKALADMSEQPAGDELMRRINIIQEHIETNELLSAHDLLPDIRACANLQFSPYLEHHAYKDQVYELMDEDEADEEQAARDLLDTHCLDCHHALEDCICGKKANIPGRIRSAWQVALNQLKAQLHAATYANTVSRAELAWVEDADDENGYPKVIIEVPSDYIRNEIVRTVLPSITRIFNWYCLGRAFDETSPSDGIEIVIKIKPDLPENHLGVLMRARSLLKEQKRKDILNGNK